MTESLISRATGWITSGIQAGSSWCGDLVGLWRREMSPLRVDRLCLRLSTVGNRRSTEGDDRSAQSCGPEARRPSALVQRALTLRRPYR